MPNRLSNETSPYLRQHAGNPVDWYPWGEEALRAARERERPIFLSIGYSACHWCHVMEHESFENDDIAGLMNRWFINIKVDREERPDLDQIYMNAVIALSGRGGWPMSVFLTPELKPFFGGTYWPPDSRMVMPGFRDVLTKVAEAWDSNRERVFQGADELTQAVVQMGGPVGERGEPAEDLLRNAMNALLRSADRQHGGFGGAPKFPHPMDLRLLLHCWKRFGSDDALSVVQLSLDKMARGGIYDHLGGGFHRYSTDAHWLVPHFEKMLYDNALLVPVYLEAYQATRVAEFVRIPPGESGRQNSHEFCYHNDDFARVARETLDYVLREMTSPDGGFYSTQDADSEGVEGKFFVWSEDEIVEQLGPDDARLFNYCYDVTAGGNWEGHNILNRVKTHAQAAKMLGVAEDELSQVLHRCRETLLVVRSQRVAPGRDEKVLVSWNGLMIAAMARGAQVLGDSRYADAARNAADFLLKNVRDPGWMRRGAPIQGRDESGRLLHGWKDGRAALNAYLDDYACLIDALVELYQTVFDSRYLDEAATLAETMRTHFYDETAGGFFYTSDDHERLIARYKDSQDNATPSGNAMAATALLKLARITGRGEFEETAVRTLETLAGQLRQHPMSGGQALLAVDFLLGPTKEIVIVDGDDADEAAAVTAAVHSAYVPNRVILRRPAGTPDDELPDSLRNLLQGKRARDGRTTVFVCERGVCHEPVLGVDGTRRALAGAFPAGLPEFE